MCLAVVAALLPVVRVEAGCTVATVAELAVTMDGMRPMVDTRINGTPERFMVDSGAFFSGITPGTARMLKLDLGPAPFGMSVRGINGSASIQVAQVGTFGLAGYDLHKVDFIVGGSEIGGAGVIGQNVLSYADVEYDLPHGSIRLMKPQDCGPIGMAYWAANRPVQTVPLESRNRLNRHTIGPVQINGTRVRATFDTGASSSILSQAAAARAGIRPDSPGVVPAGFMTGFGRGAVRVWIAPVASFRIGDEEIRNTRILFGDIGNDTDMLLGADFFIAHRVYVANRQGKLYLTYEGGPVFSIKARHLDGEGHEDATSSGSAAADGRNVPGDAAGFSRQGAVEATRRDDAAAAADFSRAIALAPSDPRYLVQRAGFYIDRKQPQKALADLDRAIRLKPDHVEALVARAGLLIGEGKGKEALADLDAASRAADPAAPERMEMGDFYILASAPDRAIPEFDQWLKAHPDDAHRPRALNGRCWARAQLGTALQEALGDCNAALRARPGIPVYLDSRALVELRMGRFDKALADYDAALARAPDMAWSLYGRGIAKLRLGDAKGSEADLAAAAKREPHLAGRAAALGIKP